MIPKVVVGGITNNIAKLTAKATKRDGTILIQNGLKNSIAVNIYIV